MGGHNSTLKVTDVTDIVSTTIANTINSSVSTNAASNSFTVQGNGNIVSNIDQNVQLTVDTSAAQQALSSATLSNDMLGKLGQKIKDSGVAGGGFLNPSKSDVSQTVQSNINTLTKTDNIMSCVNSMNASNTIAIIGSGNKVSDVTQTTTASFLSNCMQTSSATSSAVQSLTDSANQTGVYKDENIISPITDMAKSLGTAGILGFAFVWIIVIVAFAAIIYEILPQHLGITGTSRAMNIQLPKSLPID